MKIDQFYFNILLIKKSKSTRGKCILFKLFNIKCLKIQKLQNDIFSSFYKFLVDVRQQIFDFIFANIMPAYF